MANIFVGRKLRYLGTYDTAKEAALAFDHAATQQKLPSSKLNYPNGLPNDEDLDMDYDKIKKKRRWLYGNTSGCAGVQKSGKKFKARPQFEREPMLDQMFADAQNKKQAEEEQQVKIKKQVKQRKLQVRNTTGYRGVSKVALKLGRIKFRAQITIDRKVKHLGTFDNPKEAALAYDQAVRHYKLSFSKLNYPNGLPSDDASYGKLTENTAAQLPTEGCACLTR